MDHFYAARVGATPPVPPPLGVAGYPRAGDPLTGDLPTQPGAYWFHMITESLRRVVVAGGFTPSHEDLDLLLNAISALAQTDAAAVGVASAATVDLTAAAPNTRHINITGTTAITAFTVAAGRCYFVRFDGALTLTNNASIVTQTGANIVTAAGDTCILRATAANTVEVLAYTPVTKLSDTTRINVASASTVNLTASAPNTRHINITGTTAITAFTVAAGRCYFVRFDGALTLTNNASIVTQTGANIVTAAGDTCILRATAANTVEVLAYTRGIRQAVGDGQTWQDVTASRAVSTTYTNSTGRPIQLSIMAFDAGGGASGVNRMSVSVNGVVVGQNYMTGGTEDSYALVSGITVPAGATYSCAIVSPGTLHRWMELS